MARKPKKPDAAAPEETEEQKSATPVEPEDQPEGDPPDQQPLTPEEIQEILDAHELWLETMGKEEEKGKWAVLTGANLQGARLEYANLQGAVLTDANLQGAYLNCANLQGSSLGYANLQGAQLAYANLQGAGLGAVNLEEANLHGTNLQGSNLADANLQEGQLFRANLQGANLTNTNLQEANLQEANLQLAILKGTILESGVIQEEGLPDRSVDSANLTDANLRNADFSDAKLSDVFGLLPEALAGANLSNASIPEAIAKFAGLEQVEKISENARKIFLGLLLGCVYSWLTIATTTDVRLLTNSSFSPLPIIGTEIPIAWFYWTAPAILLGTYFYLHLYLMRLWEELAKLPAFFPDGKALYERAYPWLLNGLVCGHVPLLLTDRPALSRLQNAVSIFLAWWVVPLTLSGFWTRYLPRHDWGGTILLIAYAAIAVAFGILSYLLARRALRGQKPDFPRKRRWRDGHSFIATTLLAVLIMGFLSSITIDGKRIVLLERVQDGALVRDYYLFPSGLHPESDPIAPNFADPWVLGPFVLEVYGLSPFASLFEQDASTKPANWTGLSELPPEDLEGKTDLLEKARAELAQVKGANLRNANLRYAYASSTFFAKANLRNANLQGAALLLTNLQGADLTSANLQGTLLTGANLQEATLLGANLQGAYAFSSNLRKAYLHWANLQGARLHYADLRMADLTAANLQGAELTSAKLQGADLEKANLQGAELTRAKLQGADLEEVKLDDADMLRADLRRATFWPPYLGGDEIEAAKKAACAQLQSAKNWELAYRDPEMACGAPIPEPPPEIQQE